MSTPESLPSQLGSSPEPNPALITPGPCGPWIDAAPLLNSPAVAKAVQELERLKLPVPDELERLAMAELAASSATGLLYELSGRQFAGTCGPVKVRPVSRPIDADERSWGARLSPLGWYASWGMCSAYGSFSPGVMSHYGCSNPPTIDLGNYPIQEIIEVRIDGVTIPADEYEVRDGKWLVRLRTSAGEQPTERWGWPTCQIPDLPDTEPGTFSVEYTYGMQPPAMGLLACRKLAEYLLLPQLGDTSKYPTRVTAFTRQGVSATVVDVMDILKNRQLGIYEVDAFILAYNPGRNTRQAVVWSPDLGRARRTRK